MEIFCVFVLLIATACAEPGGWNEVDVNDEDVKYAANFGAEEIHSRSNSMFQSRLLTILKAESQVNCFDQLSVIISIKLCVSTQSI